MRDETKKFYEIAKLRRSHQSTATSEELPITHVRVFHKEYPRLPTVPLVVVHDGDSQLEQLLSIRKSVRNFSDTPISFAHLSQVLLSCRIQDTRREPERRTYPSGGARFPVELYLVAFNIDGLDVGVYHYNIARRALELLWKKYVREFQRELISPYLENPAATILFTSVIARSEVKYGVRSYPYSLIEAGHMGQNLHLKCTELGIGVCSVSGFIDETVATLLDLTEDEIPVYSLSIGWERKYL